MDRDEQAIQLRQLIDQKRLLDRQIAELQQAEAEQAAAEAAIAAAEEVQPVAAAPDLQASPCRPGEEEEEPRASPHVLERVAERMASERGEEVKREHELEGSAPVARAAATEAEAPAPVGGQAPAAANDQLAAMMAEVIRQNREMMLTIKAQQAELAQRAQQSQRPSFGALAGGYVYGDGQIHFNEPKLSEDRKWFEMESEEGLLG